jgi:hypothetical protein
MKNNTLTETYHVRVPSLHWHDCRWVHHWRIRAREVWSWQNRRPPQLPVGKRWIWKRGRDSQWLHLLVHARILWNSTKFRPFWVMKLTCRSKFAMTSFDIVGTFFLTLHDERKLLLEKWTKKCQDYTETWIEQTPTRRRGYPLEFNTTGCTEPPSLGWLYLQLDPNLQLPFFI